MDEKTKCIRELNDRFRKTFRGGIIRITTGIGARPDVDEIMEAVRNFDDFNPDNDPYGEHDFGAITLKDGTRIFWKIDYYDVSLKYHSLKPADEIVTTRVLTVMLASEY